jgi:tetratricopeptide (TPR) repeat protein
MLQNLIVREKNEAFARAGQRDANRKLLVALDEARLEGTRVKNKQDEGGRQNFPYLKLSTSPYQAVFGNTLSYSLFGDEESVVRKLSGRDGVERIAAALDDWSASENDADRKIWLASVARRIDPDPFRNRLRAALVSRDRAALLSMVKAPEVGSLPAVSVGLLAKAIDVVDHEAAIALLTRMRRQYPKDFWIHLDLGNQLLNSGPTRSSEAVRFLTAAVALNPESPGALIHLARALGQGKEHVEEVISLCLEALRLKPDYAEAHHELGNALQAKGRLIDAVGEYHAALKLKPDYAEANKSLGDALKTQGENDESHSYLGKATRRRYRGVSSRSPTQSR